MPATTTALSVRQSNGQFAQGNPGRPPGARNRASQRVFLAILQDFEDHQEEVLTRMRKYFLPAYFATVWRMLPTQVEIAAFDPADNAQDEVVEILARARTVIDSTEEGGGQPEALEATGRPAPQLR